MKILVISVKDQNMQYYDAVSIATSHQERIRACRIICKIYMYSIITRVNQVILHIDSVYSVGPYIVILMMYMYHYQTILSQAYRTQS